MSTADETRVMPALGRPFYLGMLYDCRSDNLVPGVTLWDKEMIKEATSRHSEKTDSFSIITEDTVQNKASSLNVEAGLSLSAMGGLVKVEGSAKYMKNDCTSSRQARVSMHYSMTSHFDQLTMGALASENIKFTEVFEKKNATHVVTGVKFGVQAFFVFDQQCSSSESVQEISGKMNILIEKVPSFQIKGSGEVKLDDEEKDLAESLRCTFIGDVNLDKLPVTFEEAVNTYQHLPEKIHGDQPGEYPTNVVPQKVWLHPLSMLDDKAAKFMQEISNELVAQVQNVVEDLHKAELKAYALGERKVCKYFSEIQDQLEHFARLVSMYKVDFLKKIVDLLPEIRGGTKQEDNLTAELAHNENSPYVYSSLNFWLKEKEQKINGLDAYIEELSKSKKIQFATSMGELETEMLKYDSGNLICLELVVPQNYDPNGTLKKMILHQSDDGARQVDLQSEKYPKDLIPNIRKGRKNFLRLVDSDATRVFEELAALTGNKECCKYAEANYPGLEKELKFIVMIYSDPKETENPKKYGAKIVFYYQGQLEEFHEPSKPAKPYVAYTTHNSITLYFYEGPAHNLEVHYQAEGKKNHEVEYLDGDSKYVILSHLPSNTAYNIKIWANYLLIDKTVESDTTATRTQINVLKLRMQKGKETPREYARIENEKTDGRHVWLCKDDKSKLKFKHFQQTGFSNWVIKSADNKIETTCTEKPPADVPYNAEWPSPYHVTEIFLAKDNKWRPFQKNYSEQLAAQI